MKICVAILAVVLAVSYVEYAKAKPVDDKPASEEPAPPAESDVCEDEMVIKAAEKMIATMKEVSESASKEDSMAVMKEMLTNALGEMDAHITSLKEMFKDYPANKKRRSFEMCHEEGQSRVSRS